MIEEARREKLERWYNIVAGSRTPRGAPSENRIILIWNDRAFTPLQIYNEIEANTRLGKELAALLGL